MSVVSSWYLDGYGHNLPEIGEKFQEVLRVCQLLGLPNPEYCSAIHSYGEEYRIYADETVLNHIEPIYRNDFEEVG